MVDWITRYDARGLPESGESDDNFDGVMETHMKFWRGNIETVDTDTNGDGVVDLRTQLVHGVVDSMEYLDPKSEQPVRVEHYKLGKLIDADIDSDADGKLDTHERYDGLHRMIGSEPMVH
jgi:hypothetical protein